MSLSTSRATPLYRSAVEQLNAVLEPELGANTTQNVAGQDNSVEATASRILSLSTGFFEAYAARYPDKDPETVAKDFVSLIRGGFEKGYAEAKDILSGLNIMGDSSPIAAGIAKRISWCKKAVTIFWKASLQLFEGRLKRATLSR